MQAFQACSALGSAHANEQFLDEMLRLHWGQGFELYWRDHHTCPTHADYQRMVLDSTLVLPCLGVLTPPQRLAASFALPFV
jgi:geranylgeranyl diphosphate synthase type 3